MGTALEGAGVPCALTTYDNNTFMKVWLKE